MNLVISTLTLDKYGMGQATRRTKEAWGTWRMPWKGAGLGGTGWGHDAAERAREPMTLDSLGIYPLRASFCTLCSHHLHLSAPNCVLVGSFLSHHMYCVFIQLFTLRAMQIQTPSPA